MKLEDIRKVLNAEWLVSKPECKSWGDRDISSCHAADLMSDVLASDVAGSLLITGLTNAQVVRVAEVLDFAAVCFVRSKKPQHEAIELAEEKGIPLLTTPMSMYESCGRLCAKGLPGANGTKESASCRTKK